MKFWKRSDIAAKLGYLNIVETNHLNNFIHFCNMKSCKKILDIGCGNGRVLLSINKEIPDFDYTGVDINKECIDVASQIKVSNGKYKFVLADMDSLNITENYDICLIDSTLSMIDEPKRCLDISVQFCKYVMITRAHIVKEETYKNNIYYQNFDQDGICWFFNKSFFDYSVCSTNISLRQDGMFDIIMEKK